MDNNSKTSIEDALIKYSQGLIYWREQSNNVGNTEKRAKECQNNIQHFTILYTEFKSIINNISIHEKSSTATRPA